MALSIPESARISKVDKRLVDIARQAASSFPYEVRVTPHGGANARRSGTPNHPHGFALDFQIQDPTSGKWLDNYKNPQTFRVYEQYAQSMRQVQLQQYPELTEDFRFGGYFGGRFGFDQMHIDINPSMNGAMANGTWEGGLGKNADGTPILNDKGNPINLGRMARAQSVGYGTGPVDIPPASTSALASLTDPGGGTQTPTPPSPLQGFLPDIPDVSATPAQQAIEQVITPQPPGPTRVSQPLQLPPQWNPATSFPPPPPRRPSPGGALGVDLGMQAAGMPVPPSRPNNMPLPPSRPGNFDWMGGGAPDAGAVPTPGISPLRPAMGGPGDRRPQPPIPPSRPYGGPLPPMRPAPAASMANMPGMVAPSDDGRVAAIQSVIDQGVTDPNEIWGNLNMDRDGNLVGDITPAEIQTVLDRGQRNAPDAQSAIADEFGPGTPFPGPPPSAPQSLVAGRPEFPGQMPEALSAADDRSSFRGGPRGDPLPHHTPITMPDGTVLGGPRQEDIERLGLPAPPWSLTGGRGDVPGQMPGAPFQTPYGGRPEAAGALPGAPPGYDPLSSARMPLPPLLPTWDENQGRLQSDALARELGFNRRQMEGLTRPPPPAASMANMPGVPGTRPEFASADPSPLLPPSWSPATSFPAPDTHRSGEWFTPAPPMPAPSADGNAGRFDVFNMPSAQIMDLQTAFQNRTAPSSPPFTLPMGTEPAYADDALINGGGGTDFLRGGSAQFDDAFGSRPRYDPLSSAISGIPPGVTSAFEGADYWGAPPPAVAATQATQPTAFVRGPGQSAPMDITSDAQKADTNIAGTASSGTLAGGTGEDEERKRLPFVARAILAALGPVGWLAGAALNGGKGGGGGGFGAGFAPAQFTPFAGRTNPGWANGMMATSGKAPYGNSGGTTNWQRGTSNAFGGGNAISGPTQALSWQTSDGRTITAHTDPWTGQTVNSYGS